MFVFLAIITLQTYTAPDELIASFAVIVSAIFRLSPCISRIQISLNSINSCQPLLDQLLGYYETFGMDNLSEIKEKKLIDLVQRFSNAKVIKRTQFPENFMSERHFRNTF